MMSRRDRLVFYLVLTLPFFAIVLKTTWLSDDAFITFRAIDHLLNGFGPVWNIGERVQTFTHPMWMLVLASAIFATGEYFYTSLFLSLILSLFAYLALVRFVPLTTTGALIGALILILSKAFIDYSTSGLENPLTHLLLALFFALYFSGKRTPRQLFWLALVAGLGALNRLDALLLFAPPLLYVAWRCREAGLKALMALLAGFVPLMLWELFSIFYYGFPFPNTAYAKINTGLPLVDVLTQGLFYLLNTSGSDLLTLVVLLVSMILPLITRRRAEIAISIGIALYLLYVIRIGGDFMMGRFLSAPLLCAVVPIMRYPYAGMNWRQIGVLLAAITLLGLANPRQSPLLATADYNVGQIDNKGIADERGHYYQRYGLLPANRLNRLVEQGRIEGVAEPHIYAHCGIGLRGFSASPYTHIVDFCGLADPLLARLPTAYDPNWRVGHPIRTIPVGYLGTMRTGRNQLIDEELAAYYDKLRLITRGNLLDGTRLLEIWRMNLGRHAGLIDENRYRYPDTVPVDLPTLRQYWADQPAGDGGIEFGVQGIRIDLGETTHAGRIDLGADLDQFEVLYFHGNQEIGRQLVNAAPLQLGDSRYNVVDVPSAIIDNGYTAMTILPKRDADYMLQHLAVFDERDFMDAGGEAADLPSLLRLYYFTFYRNEPASRDGRLDRLLGQLELIDSAEWRSLPDVLIVDLVEMPVSALHSLVDKRLSFATLAAEDGTPHLRYLGFSAESTEPDANFQGIQLQLAFEVLEPFSERYTVWFHIAAEEGDGQYMIYDYSPMESTLNWSPGTVVRFEPLLRLAPGSYEVSAGFWTPGDRRRLYIAGGEEHWLNLGTLTFEAMASDSVMADELMIAEE